MPEQNNSINFAARKTIRDDGLVKKIFDWTLKRGVKMIIITEAIVLLIFISRIGSEREMRLLSQKVKEQQIVVEQHQDFEQLFNEKQTKLIQIENIINSKTNWIEIAKNFNSSIPLGAVLTEISYSPGDIEFGAEVSSPEAFGILISKLKSNSSIKSLTLLSSRYNTEESFYELSLSLEY
ncbi:hypothetical protein A2982_03670 [candidate division WWE3 bacterium RIFCSPLOWO2_01_FULL_39_13]|uniref:Uncharacterized protein n=1 Tax=candidate division WWE3 bacterium RIFCSPLOWO2_01_FULL_39_13 TaxID=1802624 RepID=A0A1F4V561_UNCKA|nr:MAG: hypothetical protein A2982_03670 [candidate division WWE3 bacterium RIFCSPLOWO2_01_FULL_39_13]